MSDSTTSSQRLRGRLTAGIVLLLIGGFMLAANLGYRIPSNWYNYWPWLLIALGAVPTVWPGPLRDRLAGYWLLVIGLWGLVNVYNLFGLSWATSWPIFIIAAGVRVVLSGVFRSRQ